MKINLKKSLILKSVKYPSRYKLGEHVYIEISGNKIPAWIRTITFTQGKVRYSVFIEVKKDSLTTLHNLDSTLFFDGDGTIKHLDFDNYS